MERVTIIGLMFVILIGLVYADPSVTSVSGIVEHGQTITVTGSSFGGKNPAAPLIWDDGEDKTIETPSAVITEDTGGGSWDEGLPSSGSAIPQLYKIQYRNSFRSISQPHDRSNKYLVGGCYDMPNPSQNVLITADNGADSDTWFATWRVRLDDNFAGDWQPGDGSNYKAWVLQGGDRAYTPHGEHPYYAKADGGVYAGNDIVQLGSQSMFCVNNPHQIQFIDLPSEGKDWIQYDFLFRMNPGFVQLRSEGDFRGEYTCSGSAYSFGLRSFTIGGWARKQMSGAVHNEMFRYFDDIYIDTTFSRIVLADNPDYDQARVVEPQIPSAWSGSSITAEVNLGAITGNTAYLFVFDADNNHNAVGYEVNIGFQEDNVLFECNWEHSTGTSADAISNGGFYSDVDADPNAFEVFSGGPGGRNYLRIYDPLSGAFWIDDPPSIENPSELYIRYWVRDPTGGEKFNYHFIVLSPTITTFVGASDGFWLERLAGDGEGYPMSIWPSIYGGGNTGVSYAWSDGGVWGPWHSLTKDQWYLIEFHIINNPGINDYLYVRVDGTDITDSLKYGSSVLSDDNGNLAFPDLNYFRLCTYDKTTGYLTPAYDIAGIKITSGPDWIGGDDSPNPLCGNLICDVGECNTCPGDCSFADCCEDGSCNNNENCTTCPEDCGNCSVECVHDADQEPCDGTISLDELIDYIDSWKTGTKNLYEVMQAIVEWKNGC